MGVSKGGVIIDLIQAWYTGFYTLIAVVAFIEVILFYFDDEIIKHLEGYL